MKLFESLKLKVRDEARVLLLDYIPYHNLDIYLQVRFYKNKQIPELYGYSFKWDDVLSKNLEYVFGNDWFEVWAVTRLLETWMDK